MYQVHSSYIMSLRLCRWSSLIVCRRRISSKLDKASFQDLWFGAQAPGYSEKISRPMDFKKIRAQIDAGSYSKWDSLMVRACKRRESSQQVGPAWLFRSIDLNGRAGGRCAHHIHIVCQKLTHSASLDDR